MVATEDSPGYYRSRLVVKRHFPWCSLRVLQVPQLPIIRFPPRIQVNICLPSLQTGHQIHRTSVSSIPLEQAIECSSEVHSLMTQLQSAVEAGIVEDCQVGQGTGVLLESG